MTVATKHPKKPAKSAPRSVARLGAVQALYQMDLAGTDITEAVAEFRARKPGDELEGVEFSAPDLAFFEDVLRGVLRHQRQIDPLLDGQLAEGWRLGRIDSILRAILRAAAYELLARTDIPARVVITEYIDIAHAFFEGEEPKVVNGVLDRLAHRLRAKELNANGSE